MFVLSGIKILGCPKGGVRTLREEADKEKISNAPRPELQSTGKGRASGKKVTADAEYQGGTGKKT